MATLPIIKPLDGAGGYLRWKESLLLRIRTAGVAYVLFYARPAATTAAAAAMKWAHDDAVCRGHILAALSDRLLPDYARFATAAELWRALARTYDLDTPRAWRDKFNAFMFTFGSKDVLLEEIAHAEALGVAARLSDDLIASELCEKLPDIVGNAVLVRLSPHGPPRHDGITMSLVWDVARRVVASDAGPTCFWSSLYNDC